MCAIYYPASRFKATRQSHLYQSYITINPFEVVVIFIFVAGNNVFQQQTFHCARLYITKDVSSKRKRLKSVNVCYDLVRKLSSSHSVCKENKDQNTQNYILTYCSTYVDRCTA